MCYTSKSLQYCASKGLNSDQTRFIMFVIGSIVLLGPILFLSYWYLKYRRPACFPPGPKGYPFIGNLHLIFKNKTLHQTLHQFTKQHGEKIFGLQMGILPTIVMSDYELLRECFLQNADNFCERTSEVPILNKVTQGKGIFLCNGENAKIIRRKTLMTLREFGLGKLLLEERILQESQYLMQEIEKQNGQSFQFNHIFNHAVGNVMCSILFGDRLSYDDPEYREAINHASTMFSISGYQNIFFFLPIYTLPLLPIVKPQIRSVFKADEFLKSFIRSKVDAHQETFDENNIRDFVDVYLESKRREKGDPNSQVFSEDHIFQTIWDLFMAGMETVSTTLLWASYFFIKYPDIQTRCREEIRQVLGDKTPGQSDRKSLPFLEATICEIQRCGNIVPLLFMHQNSEATEIQGYKIPAHTLIIPNLYTIFRNPEHFPNPAQFNPERFLDHDGNLRKIEAFIPFGIGKRACIGEHLARLELFLFLTTLLQQFELVAADPDNLPDEDDTNFGATNIIRGYDVIAKKL